jgi:hypothetical protein
VATSFKKKLLLLPVGWLPIVSAQAEAGKGLSRISTGEILWALFLLGFIVPAGLGTLLYFLIKFLRKEQRTSYTLVIFSSVLAWWGFWLLVLKNS